MTFHLSSEKFITASKKSVFFVANKVNESSLVVYSLPNNKNLIY